MASPIKRAASKSSRQQPEVQVAAVSASAAAPTGKVSAKGAPAASVKISAEERHTMIAEAAYFVALRNGFKSDVKQNWDQAEARVDAELKAEGRL